MMAVLVLCSAFLISGNVNAVEEVGDTVSYKPVPEKGFYIKSKATENDGFEMTMEMTVMSVDGTFQGRNVFEVVGSYTANFPADGIVTYDEFSGDMKGYYDLDGDWEYMEITMSVKYANPYTGEQVHMEIEGTEETNIVGEEPATISVGTT